MAMVQGERRASVGPVVRGVGLLLSLLLVALICWLTLDPTTAVEKFAGLPGVIQTGVH